MPLRFQDYVMDYHAQTEQATLAMEVQAAAAAKALVGD